MKGTAFFDAARFYLLILVVLLALAGLASLVALQSGWLTAIGGAGDRLPPAETDDASVITVSGERRLRSETIPVDPRLVYDLSAEVRALPVAGDQIAPTRIDLGVETLDSNRRRLTTQESEHRYAVARNYPLRPIQGWVKLEGQITDEGSGKNRFSKGTRYIRIWARLNYRHDDKTVEIRNVRFTPRIEFAEP